MLRQLTEGCGCHVHWYTSHRASLLNEGLFIIDSCMKQLHGARLIILASLRYFQCGRPSTIKADLSLCFAPADTHNSILRLNGLAASRGGFTSLSDAAHIDILTYLTSVTCKPAVMLVRRDAWGRPSMESGDAPRYGPSGAVATAQHVAPL